MEQNLINDDLIRKLCALHDEAVSMQRMDKMAKGNYVISFHRFKEKGHNDYLK